MVKKGKALYWELEFVLLPITGKLLTPTGLRFPYVYKKRDKLECLFLAQISESH